MRVEGGDLRNDGKAQVPVGGGRVCSLRGDRRSVRSPYDSSGGEAGSAIADPQGCWGSTDRRKVCRGVQRGLLAINHPDHKPCGSGFCQLFGYEGSSYLYVLVPLGGRD